jgi:hypothetical protein
MILKTLIVLHRWLGVALCVLFLLWFPSGIGMMYWGMPAISTQDRLDHMPPLDSKTIVLSPEEAATMIGEKASPNQIRLSSFDGRPVYKFGGDTARIVYADTGAEQTNSDQEMRERAVSSWTGQPVSAATVESVTEIDQWMVGNRLRNLRPLWKYSWSDGQAAYIGESGEVLLHTTRASRLKAYLSTIPHWLYFTPLRKHQPVWIRVATYSAMVGVGAAIIGIIVGIWMYSPRKKYRIDGAPTGIPYRGQKRWHTVLGLVFGLATVTWTFSGSLAFLPFPPAQEQPTARAQAPQPRNNQGQGRQRDRGSRGGGNASLASALRGQVRMKDFAPLSPQQILTQFADLKIKELSFTSYNNQPLYSVTVADGSSRLISLDGKIVDGFNSDEIIGIVKKSVPDAAKLEIRSITEYDSYYQDRNRRKPLPVLLALTNDAEATRYYIDPKTATVVGNYSNKNWVSRWLYHGLHSLNFPFLYNHRPLWDIVVITFMVGGTALCVTSLVLAWRAVGKKLRQVAGTARQSASEPVSA